MLRGYVSNLGFSKSLAPFKQQKKEPTMITVHFGSGLDVEQHPTLEKALVCQSILGVAPRRITASGRCLWRIVETISNIPRPHSEEAESFTWRGDLAAVVWDNLPLIVKGGA